MAAKLPSTWLVKDVKGMKRTQAAEEQAWKKGKGECDRLSAATPCGLLHWDNCAEYC